ncbi:hypothetical protein KI387_041593, partial [Taxus chinensis]
MGRGAIDILSVRLFFLHCWPLEGGKYVWVPLGLERGVFVSTSAGNEGPGELSVTNLSPWVTTVGARTLDRDFPANIILGKGKIVRGVSLYSGKALGSDLVPLIYAGDISVGNEIHSASKSNLAEMGITKEAVEATLTSKLNPTHLNVVDTSGG